MPELSWARLATDLRCGLRRGAWYRVIRKADRHVILDVDHRPATRPDPRRRGTIHTACAPIAGRPFGPCVTSITPRVAGGHSPA